jgi:uncharacterized protein (DUF2336 family)
MNSVQLLVQDVEAAVGGRDEARRLNMLRNITNLFLEQAPQLNDDHIGIFDEVIVRLAHEIDHRARIDLARQLADSDRAPRKTVRDLALDPDIAVAGPLLASSPLVTQDDLWMVARERGQEHLLEIAGRVDLEPNVTDTLLERGNGAVIDRLVENRLARFSQAGRIAVAERLEAIADREDEPSEDQSAIIEAEAEMPALQPALPDVLGDAVTQAAIAIRALATDGALNEGAIRSMAESGKVAEALAGLALLSDLPAVVVIRGFGAPQPDPLMFMIRALDFHWETLAALLSVRSPEPIASGQISTLRTSFNALSPATAKRVLRFVALRAKTDPNLLSAAAQ